MKRVRFKLKIGQVGGDYRPVIWPIKYPYWCTGESSCGGGDKFIMVAYVDSIGDLMKQWPEARDIEPAEADGIEFTDRFPKPDWYVEKTGREDSE